MQVHYEGIHRIDADTGERGEVVDEMQEAVVQGVDCMHDQPHLSFHNGRVDPVEDRSERMIAGARWVASCTVTADAEAVETETCSGPEAGDALSHASSGEHGTREFFTHCASTSPTRTGSLSTCLASSTRVLARRRPRWSRRRRAARWRSRRSRRSHARRRRPAATSTDGASDPGRVSRRPRRESATTTVSSMPTEHLALRFAS